MGGGALNTRAIAFACCATAAAFVFVLLGSVSSIDDVQVVARAAIVAILCGLLCWISARRTFADFTDVIEATIDRIEAAADGDLASSSSPRVAKSLPRLASALDTTFAQFAATLDSAHTLALFDPVTSLSNRTHFRSETERVLKSASSSSIGALVFIDLDEFKSVNDTYGHAQGDRLLAKVGNRLRVIAAAETVRQNESGAETLVGRLAGDEFTLFFPGIADRADAARLGTAILAALVRPFDLGDHEIAIGASIGIAMYPEHGTTLTTMMRAADVAMYHAKASGRCQYQFYAENLAERMAQRTLLETELRTALDNQEFTMVFQPQVSLGDGRVQAVEGLLRWNHPVDGLRLPSTFLGCAEESGLILDIGDWAIDALSRRAADWPHLGFAPRIAVNLSPRQIARPDFFERLRDGLDRHEAPLSLIEFEVSEAVLMECGPGILDQIARLRRDGATIAIDDFGAGLSSLARLRSLPFDRVKLDPSLIAGIDREAGARDILQAVIGLSRGLGAKTVAEGVESRAQLDVLRVMGCDAAQGYAIAPPMTEEEYRVWQDGPTLRSLAA